MSHRDALETLWQHRVQQSMQVMGAQQDDDWWVAFGWDVQHQRHAEVVWVGAHCPPPDPLEVWRESLDRLVAHGVCCVLSVRHHDHPWCGTPQAPQDALAMYQQTATRGIRPVQHLITDPSGLILPCWNYAGGLAVVAKVSTNPLAISMF